MSINAVIAEMRREGRTSATVICPRCEGGSRRRRTLSVDLRDGVWLYLCHRGSCPTKGAIPATGGDGRMIGESQSVFKPKVLDRGTIFPEVTDPIGDKVVSLVGDKLRDFSRWHGLRVLETERTTHAWIIRNVTGAALGHVTRTADKQVLTWREVDKPFYGYFPPPETDKRRDSIVILVEDCLSAALLAEEGFRAIALHGTNLSREAADEICQFLPDKTFIVALDPDAAGIAGSSKVMERLTAVGATRVYRWMLTQDVHKISAKERMELATMIEWACEQPGPATGA